MVSCLSVIVLFLVEILQELDGFLVLTKDRKRLLDVGALHGIFSLAFTHRAESTRAVAALKCGDGNESRI